MAVQLWTSLVVFGLSWVWPASAHRKLLVLLLDGFRADYISEDALASLPGFREIVNRGVKADYLTPDFPSLSYPNYYTLMTGRHCEVHQMIGNYMWDPRTNKSFDIGVNRDSLMPLWWNGSEPLWVTLMKARRKVYMYYWPELGLLMISGYNPFLNTTSRWFNLVFSDRTEFTLKQHGTRMVCEEVPAYDGSILLPNASTAYTAHILDVNVLSGFMTLYSYNPFLEVICQAEQDYNKNCQNVAFQPSPQWMDMTEDSTLRCCEVEILGVRPTYCLEYKNVPTDINFANAISDALDSLKSGRADLAAIYHERIDVEGHHYGPSSPQRKDALKAVDTVLKYMTQWIQDRGLQHDLNVILFSDHGMTDIFWMDKVIELSKYVSLDDLQQVKDRGPVVSLWPAPGKHSEIYHKLRTVEHMAVYEKEAIPNRFYYKKGKFVSPLTLVADEGWFIAESREELPFWMNSTGKREGWQRGWHGYDNELMDMRGIFLAFGPDFKSNFRAAPIRSVDVYNIMCNAAGITPLPNNGSWSRVVCMLKGQTNSAPSAPLNSCALVLILLLYFV